MTAEAEDYKWPYYPWYPRDFLADTKLLSETEELMYRRLLDWQWHQDHIPSDPTDLASAAGMPVARAKKAWQRLEQYFPVWEDGKRRNRRLERERDLLIEKRRKKSAAGSAGADKRWQKDSSAMPVPLATVCQSESEAEALTTTATSAAVFAVLPEDSHEPLRRLLRASGNPEGILDDLARLMVVHPRVIPTSAGMRVESPSVVGRCLVDLANSDRPTWNPKYFRGMIERAKQSPTVPRATAPNTAAHDMKRWVEEAA